MDRHRAQAAPPTADERSSEDLGADELVAGQYADRPHLRPVLDSVLAVLSALGPATVQARKTCVSLATPRRTFAVIQATTKSRVDLGLRLDHESPGGRLLAARDLGAATVRIALTRPEDVDADVLGWLRRAYQENPAPPPPLPMASRLTPVSASLVCDDPRLIDAAGQVFRGFDTGRYPIWRDWLADAAHPSRAGVIERMRQVGVLDLPGAQDGW